MSIKVFTVEEALALALSTLGAKYSEAKGYASDNRMAVMADRRVHPHGSALAIELEAAATVYEGNAETFARAITIIKDRQALEAEAAVLRQALHGAVEEATVEGRHSNGAATFIGIGVKAFDRMQFALSATTAGQSLLDELQQLRERNRLLSIVAEPCPLHPTMNGREAYLIAVEGAFGCPTCASRKKARTALDAMTNT